VSILRRPAAGTLSEVAREWIGATAVLIGGGPSLTREQVAQVELVREQRRALRVIAVNDAYRLAPFADICYFADSEWWGWHKDRPDFQAFAGQKCSISDSGGNIKDPAVHILRNANGRGHSFGLSLDPKQIVTGSNSGYQALNIAVLAGAKTIILIGFDAREPTATSKTHWFGDHPKIEPVAAYAEYRKAFSAGEAAIKAAGVRVINCSPGSAINSFEKLPLEAALQQSRG
jgi:hypothetical protein